MMVGSYKFLYKCQICVKNELLKLLQENPHYDFRENDSHLFRWFARIQNKWYAKETYQIPISLVWIHSHFPVKNFQ